MADLFAADGHELVLLARGSARLESTAAELEARHGIRAHVRAEDLADPGAPDRIVEGIGRLGLVVDHLVNNAGFSVYGPFLETDREVERDMLQVNAVAPTALARLFAPGMAARGAGRILNVASTAAFQPGPRMAVYYATKAYLLSLSVALSVELEGTGVSVTALCPGATRTGFAERAGLERSRLFNEERFLLDPGEVARAGYEGMLRGDRVVVPGLVHKAHDLAVRFVPRGLAARLVSGVQAPLD
ncbi:MAG: SDR family NAD(P)-dependent oxidoreductase [Gemmatimonadota bacterium]